MKTYRRSPSCRVSYSGNPTTPINILKSYKIIKIIVLSTFKWESNKINRVRDREIIKMKDDHTKENKQVRTTAKAGFQQI